MKKILKKITAIICVSSVIISMLALSVRATDDIKVQLDGQILSFDVPPQIINDRTMVPMRVIFETLGYGVDWNQKTRTVTSTNGNTTIKLTIDSNTMHVNGNTVTLDSPACVVDDRTLVPVRAISEASGYDVQWDGETRTVIISAQDHNELSLNYDYYYLKPNETVQLSIKTNTSATHNITWSATEGVKVDNNGLVSLTDGYGKVTATTENGETATCYIMKKSEEQATKDTNSGKVYNNFPDILSIENAIPEICLWYVDETSYPELDIYYYNYTYLVPTMDIAEKYAHDYAYFLKDNGYHMIRGEDDPFIHGGSAVLYELVKLPESFNTEDQYSISIEGEPLYGDGYCVRVSMDKNELYYEGTLIPKYHNIIKADCIASLNEKGEQMSDGYASIYDTFGYEFNQEEANIYLSYLNKVLGFVPFDNDTEDNIGAFIAPDKNNYIFFSVVDRDGKKILFVKPGKLK